MDRLLLKLVVHVFKYQLIMKKTLGLRVLIASLFCMLLMPSCDNALFKTEDSIKLDGTVKVRTDCEDCDDTNECCCFIELDTDTAANLHLCGTSDGLSACQGDEDICDLIGPAGGGQFVLLTSALNRRQAFCMYEDHALRIKNTSTTDGADIIISCQNGSMLPQFLQFSIPAQDSVYVKVNEGCELEGC
jgi:hypothetical protein